jgi:dTDP-glucose pyrophosphorylase
MMKSKGELISNPALVVMAAGIGSRYGGLKQIEPVGPNGEIILDYSIYDAMQAGFGKIIFVIKREIEQAFRARIEQTIGKLYEIEYVNQELGNLPEGFEIPEERRKPWGTAHAVLSCRSVVDGPFAVINADDFYGRTAFESVYAYLNRAGDHHSGYDFCVVGYKLENTMTEHGHVARGVCKIDQEGYLVEVRERTRIEKINKAVMYSDDGSTWIEIPGDNVVSMNMWGFTPELFPELEKRFLYFLQSNENDLSKSEYFLPDVVNQLLYEKRAAVKVLPSNEQWFGVTYKKDMDWVKQAVGKLIDQGIYPETIWE